MGESFKIKEKMNVKLGLGDYWALLLQITLIIFIMYKTLFVADIFLRLLFVTIAVVIFWIAVAMDWCIYAKRLCRDDS